MSETSSSAPNDSQVGVYERCDAAYLRQLHEASGMDETQLARIACLSVAQVRQLEAGGDSLFYSVAVKRQAYKRLLMILGAPPPSETVSLPADHATEDPPPRQTIDDIVALSERSQYLEHRPVVDFLRDMRMRLVQYRQPLSAFGFLMLALVLLVMNWPEGDISASNKVTPTDATFVARSTEGARALNGASDSVADSKGDSKADSKVDGKPAGSADTKVDAPNNDANKTETAKSENIAVPAAVEKEASVSANLAANHASNASNTSTANAKGCAFNSNKLPEVVPSMASKEARYVYFVSPVDTVVCVVDGSKRATTLNLRVGEGRSVYGPPPWQVSGVDLNKVQVFFQGWRVALPDAAAQGVALIEKPN